MHLFSLKNKLLFGVFCLSLTMFYPLKYWYTLLTTTVTTNNAYTATEVTQVTSSVGGIVKRVNITDTHFVKEGDILLVIDDIDAKLSFANATANVAKAQAEQQRAQANYQRRILLVDSDTISKEEFSNVEYTYHATKAALAAAELALEKAKIDLDRTVVRAPTSGIIAKCNVQDGQKLHSGAQLMLIVPLEQVYVNANFKEKQLRKIKIGQTVELVSDLYGSDVIFHGKVVGIAGGTGSVFSIIPAQNATGNWIKVVQRLPVRIALNKNELILHPLRIGLSMYVKVKIKKG